MGCLGGAVCVALSLGGNEDVLPKPGRRDFEQLFLALLANRINQSSCQYTSVHILGTYFL